MDETELNAIKARLGSVKPRLRAIREISESAAKLLEHDLPELLKRQGATSGDEPKGHLFRSVGTSHVECQVCGHVGYTIGECRGR